MTLNLFTPARVGSIETKNRVFMAPLTRNRADNDTDIPTSMAVEYYAQRASAGLIITEATQISAMGKGYDGTPGIYTDEQVAAWKDITDAVHAKGGKIIIQLWHVGRISHTSVLPTGEYPLAPSAIQPQAQTFANGEMVQTSMPREMTEDDIRQTVQDYRMAAENAKAAGFDGVEIHAANGYLINQFLSDHSNKREDRYGGSIESRSRLLFQVLDAVAEIWDLSRIGIRFSPTGSFNDMNDSDPLNNYISIIERLNSYDLAYLHMVEKFPGIEASDEDLLILKDLKNKWGGFYMANGDYDGETANEAIESDYAHAVAFGRPFIANPDLPERLQENASLNEPDPATFYGGGAEGYIDYPFMDGSTSSEAA